MSFRAVAKEQLNATVPPELGTLVREYAARKRRSLSYVTTELLCRGLEINPGIYGIEPAGRPHPPAVGPVTSV